MKKNDFTPEHTSDSYLYDTPDTDNMELEDYDDSVYKRKGIYRFFNIHMILLLLILLMVGYTGYRILNWGVKVDLDEIFKDGPGTYEDNFDFVLPLMDADRNIVKHKEPATIVAFGNSPFSDDRNSKDNLANLIADETGATVYNCSISTSHLACDNEDTDIFSFYWLAHLACGSDIEKNYIEGKEILGDDYPKEADEVIDTLTSLDFNTVDVITIMYDATDYLMGNNMYSDQNSTDIYTFTGNLEAGIELIQQTYPHIRIIVMSPTYAYAVDENGNYVSSDKYIYEEKDVLSTYVIKEFASATTRNVSFVDHLYNTITAANADDYLIDNIHLNAEGRKLIAKRFEYFFNYYNKGYSPAAK